MTTITPVKQTDVPTRVTGRDSRGRRSRIATSDDSLFLDVFTMHIKRRDGAFFITRVSGVRVKPAESGSVFSVETSAPMSAKTVELTDAPDRYNAKRHTLAHEAGVRRVLELIDAGITGDLLAVLAETPGL